MSVIAEMAVNVVARTTELAGGLNQAAGAFGGLGSKLSGMIPSLSTVNALLGGIAFGGMAAEFVSVADGLEGILQTSQRLGVATDMYAALQLGAKNANVETESFDKGITKLYKSLGDAMKGSAAASKGFDRLNIDIDKFAKLDLATQLQIIAEKLERMPDGASRTAASMALFGKAGTDMQMALAGGAESVREMMAAAEEFGMNTFTEERLAGVVAFNDAMDRMRSIIGVEVQKVVIDIAPLAAESIEALAKLMPMAHAIMEWTAGGVAGAGGNPDLNNKNPSYGALVDKFGAKTTDTQPRSWSKFFMDNAASGAAEGTDWWRSNWGFQAGLDASREMLGILKDIRDNTRGRADNFSIGN